MTSPPCHVTNFQVKFWSVIAFLYFHNANSYMIALLSRPIQQLSSSTPFSSSTTTLPSIILHSHTSLVHHGGWWSCPQGRILLHSSPPVSLCCIHPWRLFLFPCPWVCPFYIKKLSNGFFLDLHRNNQGIPKWEKAVEGISGAAVIYTAFAVIFTCFLGGVTVFSALGILLDLLFLGGFIAIAILGRGGLRSCRGSPNSIFGQGYRKACKLEKGVFVVAVIGA